ncbi:MAG TPA: hypothetical protein VJ716_01710 [Gaiellaceae bacterium]|nr:hypothetical protein [Gaiellaceae bacterium]
MTTLTHKRLMYLLLIASLVAFILGATHGVHGGPGHGMSDGGGL